MARYRVTAYMQDGNVKCGYVTAPNGEAAEMAAEIKFPDAYNYDITWC